MERINLTPKTLKILPVTINNIDYDLEIDTRDIALTSLILNMADKAHKLDEKIKEISNTRDIESMRAVANEALNMSDEFYRDICSLIPSIYEHTQGRPIRDFRVWSELLFALANLISEGKAQKEVSQVIAEEESDAIGEV